MAEQVTVQLKDGERMLDGDSWTDTAIPDSPG